MIKFFQRNKKQPENLNQALKRLEAIEKDFLALADKIQRMKKQARFSVQKTGIIRFNPFKEVGGDQSFSLALLDGNDNGVVITSLYTREENRVYGKPIEQGQSKYSLSEEEKQAIKKAQMKDNE